MEQLLVEPARYDRLAGERHLLPSAVEEMLRWVSPIKNMSRTVTREVELDGRTLAAGDTVLLLYESANFDESRFADADRFDIERSPNEHIAFGFGPHVCLGAALARVELHAIFDRLLTRLPDVRLAGDGPPPRALTGITEMPVEFTPTARLGSRG
jgi:cytochrome P450 family 142 subfamily A polypeptide 1